ncbi:MAG TPA: hypothetical protein VFN73_03120 [Propionibacteriaceae bacterium]|nr:hypothetical protein [Propionibacteriaceae bacterium]
MSYGDLHRRFFEELSDPTAAELAELDSATLLSLIRPRDKADVARFGRDMGVPVGRKHLNERDADRLLASLRAQNAGKRLRAAFWLTRDVSHPLVHALLEKVGDTPPPGKRWWPPLEDLIAEYGAPVLRLAIISATRIPGVADRLLACAIVDGSLIPPEWQEVADELADEAEELVGDLCDAADSCGTDDADDERVGVGVSGDDGAPEVIDPFTSAVGVDADDAGRIGEVPTTGDGRREPGEPGEGTASVVAPAGADDADIAEEASGSRGAVEAPTVFVAVGKALGADPIGVNWPVDVTRAAGNDAEVALRRLAAAVVDARRALEGPTGGPFADLATLGPAVPAAEIAETVLEQVAQVRAMAATAGAESDEAAFLAGLGRLVRLGDQGERMAAGMGLLDDPVGKDFGGLLMAAAAGSIALGSIAAEPGPFTVWAEALAAPIFAELVDAWGGHSADGTGNPQPGAPTPPDGSSAGDQVGDIRDGATDAAAGDIDDARPPVDARPLPPADRDEAEHDQGSGDRSSDDETVDQVAAIYEGSDDQGGLDHLLDDPDGDGPNDQQVHDRPGRRSGAIVNAPGTPVPAAPKGVDTPQVPMAAPTSPTADAASGRSSHDGGAPLGNASARGAVIEARSPRTSLSSDDTEELDADGSSGDTGEAAEADAETWASLFAAGRWSLAAWLARALGDDGRAAALETIAVIDSARSATGLAVNTLYDIADAIEPAAIGGDDPVQLLALAAAMRASLVAPFAGTVGPLGSLSSFWQPRCPSLAALGAAALAAAESGLPLVESLAAPADESERSSAAEAAAGWLARPRHTTFERADHIWSSLAGRDGLIGGLLGPVVADDVAQVAAVKATLATMSPNRIDAELRAQDNLVRRGGSKRLHGTARTTLQRWCGEAIRLASEWVRAAEASLEAAPGDLPGRHQAELAALRRAADSTRTGALAELGRLAEGPDVELAGAAQGAATLIGATLALIDGASLAGPEPAPELARRIDLLRTRLALGADGTPVRLTDLTPAIACDAATTWSEAFARRCAVYDFAGSADVIDLVRATDPEAAAGLEAAQDRARAEARKELAARRERLQTDLDAGRRNGLVDETYAAAVGSYLLAAEDGRPDLGTVLSELDAAEATLAEAADAARKAFDARLAKAGSDLAETVLAAARNIANQGDLATAEEILIQREPVTEHHSDISFAEFFPAVVDDLADGIDPAVVKAAENRSRFGDSLDFSALSAEAATATARALGKWRGVAGGRRTDLRGDLAPALRLLGIGSSGERIPANLPRSAERVWLDLTGVDRTGQRLVPAFGSAAGPEQRLLVVWHQPPPETLLSYLEQDPSDRSVIVCYLGTIPPAVRRDMARRLRRLPPAKAVVVVDDAVLAWAAAKGLGTFEVTMRATLPFSAVNPYLTGHRGAIPEEMFYGRVAERQLVTAEVGTNLIYGGRRLGKSALLHEAGRWFEETPGQVAVYVDLDPAAIRATRRADALWDLVAPKLAEKGVVAPRSGRRRVSNQDSTDAAVRAWLEAHPGGRLLLLLDECDAFFDADGANNFTVTRTLKEMMERNGRFKVVFAGLHQVQRFATIQNTPFAHLGRSVPIGPMSPRFGYSLLAKPLLALGWELSPELASRVLAYTNYLPILLQEVGHALVELLQSRPCEGPIPAKVTADDISEVLSSEALAAAIHERFTLTLNLDPRYTVISYVVAIEALEEGVERTVSLRDLRSRCGYYWPAGFADVREDEFRSLLEELVGLGILARSGSAYRMRSPNVLRLLGTREEIEDKLLDVAERGESPSLFSAGDTHRALDLVSGRHSPLTETQIADVTGVGSNQLRVVVGTLATGVDAVEPALAAVERDTSTFNLRVANKPATFAKNLEAVPERTHHVVFADLREVNDESLRRALTQPSVRLPAAAGATRSAVILIGPGQLPAIESVLGDGTADVIVSLGRYSPTALRTWALNVEGGFSDPAVTAQVLQLTGGWPMLLDRLAADGRARGAAAALEQLRVALSADPGMLLGPAGLAGPGPMRSAFAQLVDLLDGGAADVETVLDLLDDVDGVPAAALLEAVQAAGAVMTSADGNLSTEPVVTAAWYAARAG